MSKRPNPHRRLLAAQAALIREQKQVQSAVQGAEMAKLQQGRVRSHMGRGNTTSATFMQPNWTSEDTRPKHGKSVKGQFVPRNPNKAPRFGVKK